MKKSTLNIPIACVLIIILSVCYFLYKNFQGIKPVITPAPADISTIIDEQSTPHATGTPIAYPLQLPPGFSISILAKNIPGARVMKLDREGNMWVSETSKGKVVMIEIKEGKAIATHEVFTNLKKPHGLAFDPKNSNVLYIGEEDKISRVDLTNKKLEKLVDLPTGGRHFTRTLGFGPDERLYVSIGSACDVCVEKDTKRATIYSLNKDGSDFKLYAKGLRNTVFFTWDTQGRMWGTDMGRDFLGDNLPPDEVNIIEEGKNYGWPICYGKNIHDTVFDKNTYIRNPCMEPFETPSTIDLPAHGAPLGIAFINGSGWPEEYQGSLLIAQHGSWNRSVPDGYKIIRITFDAAGNEVKQENFISGWLTKNNTALGRPVDILATPSGIMYISDDKAGVIYQVLAP